MGKTLDWFYRENENKESNHKNNCIQKRWSGRIPSNMPKQKVRRGAPAWHPTKFAVRGLPADSITYEDHPHKGKTCQQAYEDILKATNYDMGKTMRWFMGGKYYTTSLIRGKERDFPVNNHHNKCRKDVYFVGDVPRGPHRGKKCHEVYEEMLNNVGWKKAMEWFIGPNSRNHNGKCWASFLAWGPEHQSIADARHPNAAARGSWGNVSEEPAGVGKEGRAAPSPEELRKMKKLKYIMDSARRDRIGQSRRPLSNEKSVSEHILHGSYKDKRGRDAEKAFMSLLTDEVIECDLDRTCTGISYSVASRRDPAHHATKEYLIKFYKWGGVPSCDNQQECQREMAVGREARRQEAAKDGRRAQKYSIIQLKKFRGEGYGMTGPYLNPSGNIPSPELPEELEQQPQQRETASTHTRRRGQPLNRYINEYQQNIRRQSKSICDKYMNSSIHISDPPIGASESELLKWRDLNNTKKSDALHRLNNNCKSILEKQMKNIINIKKSCHYDGKRCFDHPEEAKNEKISLTDNKAFKEYNDSCNQNLQKCGIPESNDGPDILKKYKDEYDNTLRNFERGKLTFNNIQSNENIRLQLFKKVYGQYQKEQGYSYPDDIEEKKVSEYVKDVPDWLLNDIQKMNQKYIDLKKELNENKKLEFKTLNNDIQRIELDNNVLSNKIKLNNTKINNYTQEKNTLSKLPLRCKDCLPCFKCNKCTTLTEYSDLNKCPKCPSCNNEVNQEIKTQNNICTIQSIKLKNNYDSILSERNKELQKNPLWNETKTNLSEIKRKKALQYAATKGCETEKVVSFTSVNELQRNIKRMKLKNLELQDRIDHERDNISWLDRLKGISQPFKPLRNYSLDKDQQMFNTRRSDENVKDDVKDDDKDDVKDDVGAGQLKTSPPVQQQTGSADLDDDLDINLDNDDDLDDDLDFDLDDDLDADLDLDDDLDLDLDLNL